MAFRVSTPYSKVHHMQYNLLYLLCTCIMHLSTVLLPVECSQLGKRLLSTSPATVSPTVSLTASRTDCHTRGCSPVPGPRDSHSLNMSRHACLTLWRLSARIQSRTAASNSSINPTSYHWTATRHTTSWFSLLRVGAEKGLMPGLQEPEK